MVMIECLEDMPSIHSSDSRFTEADEYIEKSIDIFEKCMGIVYNRNRKVLLGDLLRHCRNESVTDTSLLSSTLTTC